MVNPGIESSCGFHIGGNTMKKILIATVAAIALASGAASAADMSMPVKARPAPAPVYNWTGCFIGAGAGYGMDRLRTQTLTAAGAVVGAQLDQGQSGWLGIGSIGCDYQFTLGNLGQWVIGIAGDGSFDDIHGLYTGNNGSVGLNSGDMRVRSQWDIGGRIGYLITPTLLGYESGGYSSARFSGATLLPIPGGPAGGIEPAATYNGYFLGSGLEYQFTWLPIQGLFLKTEYRYYDYRQKTLTNLSLAGVPNGNVDLVHPHVQTITTELVYRFNWH